MVLGAARTAALDWACMKRSQSIVYPALSLTLWLDPSNRHHRMEGMIEFSP